MSVPGLDVVSLRDEPSALEAAFVPAAGMICSSLRHRGEELLAQNSGVAEYARHGKTMGIPLLYPWANRLAGFAYSVAGRSVTVPHDPARIATDDNGLPIHGVIAGRMPWELLGAPYQRGSSLEARLQWRESDSELFEVFPFRHDVHYQAHLSDGRLQVAVTVHACGSDPVPVAFGFHPYLSLPGTAREEWQVELPAMRHLTLDGEQIPVGAEREKPAQRFELGAREFDDGFEDVVDPARFSVCGGGRRVALELLEGYGFAQVFAPKGSQFICFEPMTAPANSLRSGAGLGLLAAGERRRASFSVSVEDAKTPEARS
jgi:aldose 1-epimerase